MRDVADLRCDYRSGRGAAAGDRGGNKRLRYQTAAGSMRETLACIEVAVALGYMPAADEGLGDRIRKIIATLVRLVGR